MYLFEQLSVRDAYVHKKIDSITNAMQTAIVKTTLA